MSNILVLDEIRAVNLLHMTITEPNHTDLLFPKNQHHKLTVSKAEKFPFELIGTQN